MSKEIDSEFGISKSNRRRRQESEKNAQIYHPPLLFSDRAATRKEQDRRINLIVKKARKK